VNRKALFRLPYFILILIFFLSSCSQKEVSIPEEVLKPEQMTAVIVDIQLAESALLQMEQNGQNAGLFKKRVYDLLFEKHKIKREKFDSSLSYYSLYNVPKLDAIYAEVITQLSQQQSLNK